jgi:hypothetical protein
MVYLYNGQTNFVLRLAGAASGANSIYRRTQFTDFGDKRVGEMCMIVVFFTYLTLPHDLLPVNHAEQHNSSLNQTEI